MPVIQNIANPRPIAPIPPGGRPDVAPMPDAPQGYNWFYQPPPRTPVVQRIAELTGQAAEPAAPQPADATPRPKVVPEGGGGGRGGYGHGFNADGTPAMPDYSGPNFTGTGVGLMGALSMSFDTLTHDVEAMATGGKTALDLAAERGLPDDRAWAAVALSKADRAIETGQDLGSSDMGAATAGQAAANAEAAAAMEADFGIGLDAFGGPGPDVGGGGGDGGGGDGSYICTRAFRARRLTRRNLATLQRLRTWTAREEPALVDLYDRLAPQALARLSNDHPIWQSVIPLLERIAKLVALNRYRDALRSYIVMAGAVYGAAHNR